MRHKRGNKRMMVVKVDFEKAYDKVRWQFLREILGAVGLSEAYVNLIMYCVESASLSLLWNGDKLESFKPSRGIRQRDPLAPYLFLLCMDILSQAINDSVAKKEWIPVQASRGDLKFHIYFLRTICFFLGRLQIGRLLLWKKSWANFVRYRAKELAWPSLSSLYPGTRPHWCMLALVIGFKFDGRITWENI